LAEAIVACFVMTAAMVVSAALYHTALNHSVRIDRKHRASRVVERRFEEIRSWSREQHGTNGDLLFTEGWSDFNETTTDPEYPEFEITTRIIQQDLYSPSSEFEVKAFAAQADQTVPPEFKNEERQLNDSSFMVEVQGRWGEGPTDSITARTLIADPVKDYGWTPEDAHQAISLTNTPNFLAENQRFTLSATVKDARDRVVKNAVVQWYIDPKSSGNGTIRVSPLTPDRAEFINVVLVDKDPDVDGDELTVHTGGSVRIVARVRLGGLEAINKTDPILLGAPP
jgi:hypothetical protein